MLSWRNELSGASPGGVVFAFLCKNHDTTDRARGCDIFKGAYLFIFLAPLKIFADLFD